MSPTVLQADTEFIKERERQLSEWQTWLEGKKSFVEEREKFIQESLGDWCVCVCAHACSGSGGRFVTSCGGMQAPFYASLCTHSPTDMPLRYICRYRSHDEFVLQEVEVSVVLDTKEEPLSK